MDRIVRQIHPEKSELEGTAERPLSEFLTQPNIVLLGDPGAGKSYAFRELAAAGGGRYLTARAFLTLPVRNTGGILFIDGLDERRGGRGDRDTVDALAAKLKLHGVYPDLDRSAGGDKPYSAQHVPAGFGIMFGAGTLSGLLGIGSGAVKVLAMDQAMRLPFKVSTTTSNFMIGVTAAASAGIYLYRGYIDPAMAMPVMLGVLGGSMIGSQLLVRARVATLKIIFGVVIVALGVEMIFNGVTGRI